MDIDFVKKRKVQMEEEIIFAIDKFVETTGVDISGMDVRFERITYLTSKKAGMLRPVIVKTVLDI